ncbi:epoxyqueuosine reductase [Candidatus Poribacteria bacterium]|nr:epoxyqueuosine reductase [Candidatus Poribacteria bacterium]
MYNLTEIKENLKQIGKNEGCLLFGVADIKEIKKTFNIQPVEILQNLDYAISVGYVLSGPILETNIDSPSKLYAHHYKKINILLDVVSLKIASNLHEYGYNALPVPVSQLLDWTNFSAHLSHRRIGYLAGLGYMGRNNLLVNLVYGAQVRYVSILTDCPLPADKPLDITCPEHCYNCKNLCPANAISESYEDFNVQKCIEKLTIFSRQQGIGQHICGVCVRACRGKRNVVVL